MIVSNWTLEICCEMVDNVWGYLKETDLGDKATSSTNSIDKEECAHYQQVSQEIERGEKNEGVWAKTGI